MNREVEFRGLRADGVWLYGMPTATFNYIFRNSNYDWFDNFKFGDFKVNPKTIGQYTGFKDKNDVKIFEGDVIEGKSYKYKVVYENGSYVCYNAKLKDWDGGDYRWGLLSRAGELQDFPIKVIGNIHENPELLETEK